MSSYMMLGGGVMNFNIYLSNALGEALKRLAKRRKMTRNALIRNAVEELVAQDDQSETWSAAVLNWHGDPTLEPFETHRAGLREPAADPLA
jgi:predicted transcriptional regulator